MAKKKPQAPEKPALIGFGRREMPDEAPSGNAPTPEEEEGLIGELRDFITDRRKAQKRKEADAPGSDDFSDPNFDALMEEIGKRFEVADSPEEAGLQLTTKEVYERLQAFYPSMYYGVQSVFNALKELGFKLDDPYKNMNFVWLFK